MLDAGASGSKDIKVLRNHLQEIRSQIVSVSTHGGAGTPLWDASTSQHAGPTLVSAAWFGFSGGQVDSRSQD